MAIRKILQCENRQVETFLEVMVFVLLSDNDDEYWFTRKLVLTLWQQALLTLTMTALNTNFKTVTKCFYQLSNFTKNCEFLELLVLLLLATSFCHGGTTFFDTNQQKTDDSLYENNLKNTSFKMSDNLSNTSIKNDDYSESNGTFDDLGESLYEAVISTLNDDKSQNETTGIDGGYKVKQKQNYYMRKGVQVTSGKFKNGTADKEDSNSNFSQHNNNYFSEENVNNNNRPTSKMDTSSLLSDSNTINDDIDEIFNSDEDNDQMDKLSEEINEMLQSDWDIKKEHDLVSFGERIKDNLRFPSLYYTQGVLTLPYDNIIEPFEAWYAGKMNMSRIDYYYG